MKREDAIKMIQAHKFPTPTEAWQILNNEAIDKAIEALSADRPNGEWIEIPNSDFWECSVCGKPNYPTDYCPDCGAKMEARYKNEML